MPSDKEIREQQEMHPGLRVWGAMPGGLSETSEPGDFPVVPFDDFIAAVAAATENAVRDYAEAHYANGVKRYGEGVKAARDAVAALQPDWSRSNEDGIGGILNGVAFTRAETFTYYIKRDSALAAIDALRTEKS